MIWGAIEKSAKTLIFKPHVMIPMLIVSIVTYLLTDFSASLLENFVTDIFLYGEIIAEFDPFLYMIGTYPMEITLLILGGIVALFVSVVAFISISKFCDGESFVESVNSSIMEWKRNIGLVIFGAVVFFLFFVIWNIAMFIINFIDTALSGVLGPLLYYIIVPIVTIILIAIFAVKLSFVLPAFAKGDNLREAIRKSWELTNDSFWNALIFIVILLIITFIIAQIFLFLALAIVALDLVFLIIGEIISTTFLALGISYYYYLR
ncbi:MAG: hypothetical protein HON47_02985 [Candidatus Diapherotrites archaeon]|jgi:hypothetical protein|uniref:Glycerophosphoryl diester phosphodiesterase membrane domain-containing protein n=1 Tax=Candidatus Iainarchaeum sp. TaxID=3101447 RepID=A0A8T5GES7_9ARCH|nr:hypothetical protein [Candidatus Diapherotrites archaeon]MBT7241182.1 hypothetical protein [Candidatus Diapherotrites archaeon]